MLTGIGIGVPFTRRRGFSAGDLFANSEVGVWYDPSDFSTMFQDRAGTTPVTAVEQPVGLLLDKSKGLVLTTALSSDFSSSAGWSLTNATISGGTLNLSASASVVSGGSVAGRLYKVTYTITAISPGTSSIKFYAGSTGAGEARTTTGTFTEYITQAGATSFYFFTGAGFVSGTVDDLIVQEVAGYHATQATSTARPVLRAGLDYDGVDDKHSQSAGGGSTTQFFLCAGIKPEGGAGAVRVLWSDAGTNTGYIVRINAANQLELAAGNATAYTTIATVATLSVGTAYVVTVWDDGTNLNVQVNNNAVASVARPVVAAGTATASIGSDNGAATGWFNGLIYSLIQVKNDAGTDAERTSTKAYVASKSGVTL